MRNALPRGGVHVVLSLYFLIAGAPMLLVVMTSFKARNAIFAAPLAPPDPATFSLVGYTKVLRVAHFGAWFANSLIVTLGAMVFVLLFGAMAAWALTEYRLRWTNALALYMAIGVMVPIRLGSIAILTM